MRRLEIKLFITKVLYTLYEALQTIASGVLIVLINASYMATQISIQSINMISQKKLDGSGDNAVHTSSKVFNSLESTIMDWITSKVNFICQTFGTMLYFAQSTSLMQIYKTVNLAIIILGLLLIILALYWYKLLTIKEIEEIGIMADLEETDSKNNPGSFYLPTPTTGDNSSIHNHLVRIVSSSPRSLEHWDKAILFNKQENKLVEITFLDKETTESTQTVMSCENQFLAVNLNSTINTSEYLNGKSCELQVPLNRIKRYIADNSQTSTLENRLIMMSESYLGTIFAIICKKLAIANENNENSHSIILDKDPSVAILLPKIYESKKCYSYCHLEYIPQVKLTSELLNIFQDKRNDILNNRLFTNENIINESTEWLKNVINAKIDMKGFVKEKEIKREIRNVFHLKTSLYQVRLSLERLARLVVVELVDEGSKGNLVLQCYIVNIAKYFDNFAELLGRGNNEITIRTVRLLSDFICFTNAKVSIAQYNKFMLSSFGLIDRGDIDNSLIAKYLRSMICALEVGMMKDTFLKVLRKLVFNFDHEKFVISLDCIKYYLTHNIIAVTNELVVKPSNNKHTSFLFTIWRILHENMSAIVNLCTMGHILVQDKTIEVYLILTEICIENTRIPSSIQYELLSTHIHFIYHQLKLLPRVKGRLKPPSLTIQNNTTQ